MKKVAILLILVASYLGLNGELDYQMQSEFGFGDISYLKYSDGKIYSKIAYGFVIYKIQENGCIEIISTVRDDFELSNYYSYDKLGEYSGYLCSDDPINYPSYFSIYDTSVPNEVSLMYNIQIDSDNMLSAELFENYFIRKTGEYEYTIFDYENFQPVSQVDEINLIYDTKFNDQGAVLYDLSDNCYYYYIINDDGVLHKKYNLGEDERKVAIDGNKLIAYSISDVNFYNITEDDSLEYRGAFYMSQALSLTTYKIVYKNNRIAFTSYEGIFPVITKLYLYDVSDVSSAHSINLLDSANITNRPYSDVIYKCSLVQNDNALYLSSPFGDFLLQASISNDAITLEDIGQESIINLSSSGWLKDDVYYVQNTQRNCSLSTYSFENTSDIQKIPNDFPEQSMYGLLEDNQKVTRYDEMTGVIYLYDFSGHELILEATYAPQPVIPQSVFGVVKWDGTHLIYRSQSSLYSLKYQNGDFIPTWSINNNDFYFYKFSYAIYENYIYEHNSNTGVIIHEFDVEEINQINMLTIPFNSGHGGLFINGDIMTVDNKIVDLSYDPINLSHRYNLNQVNLSYKTTKYNNYLIYVGTEKIYENGVHIDWQVGVSIYKLIDDVPIRVGAIDSNMTASVQVLPGGTADSFDLLVYHKNYYAIYSCHATPNGQLEITPVTLNAINYPNPFNPETTISYDISQAGSVSIDVYNLKGQKVKTLVNEKQEAGKHSVIWQGNNDKGQPVSSGTYFYRVKSANQEIVKKMLLMK